MATQMETYTPLTDAELDWMDQRMAEYFVTLRGKGRRYFQKEMGPRAAAEIRALRAERDDLLAALKVLFKHSESKDDTSDNCVVAEDAARAAIARAEGRAEG